MQRTAPCAAADAGVSDKNMKTNDLRASISLTLVLSFLLAASIACAANTPKEVVEEFCRLDFEGARLSSETYGPIVELISYSAEPGWDIVIGITKYEIQKVHIKGNNADVRVRYHIYRSWPVLIEDIASYVEETFYLKRIRGSWKISKYIFYPRVSADLLCTRYGHCTDRTLTKP